MNQQRNAHITATLGQALRDKIGEQRFNTWFTSTGARIEARDDAIVVKVDEVYVHFLRNAFKSDIVAIAQDVLGDSRPVVFENAEPSQKTILATRRDFNPSQSSPQQPTLLPFPPQSGETPISTRRQTSRVFVAPRPARQEASVQPPKRKRGRPRKNPAPVADAPVPASPSYAAIPPTAPVQNYAALGAQGRPIQYYDASAPQANFALHSPATFLPDALDAPGAPSPQSVAPAQETAPPKRKRGRPRKNPAPTPAAPETPVVSFPFADAYNRSSLGTPTEPTAAPATLFSISPTVDFSNDERAVVSLGSFDDAQSFAAPPEPPRRRGRPKGSVNRANRVSDSEPVDDVQRDANGYIVARTPQGAKPQVRLDGGEPRRFASLKTFAVGPSNETAVKMLELIVIQPAIMSPLYIHGSTSVGKTRLLEGVCEAYLRKSTATRKPPLYMTADQFTTQFTSYVAGGAHPTMKFRDRFRNISLFALDDIQFLEGKKATQIELVKTLDSLRALNVQVVVSGNRPLVDMTYLREELITRMQSGLNVEIAPPERETLAVILRQIAAERGLVVPEDVCRYVVSRFATHAREVIGAVNRLYAMHLTTGAPVTLDFAREALAGLAPVVYRNIRMEDVERVVQEAFALEPNALKSASRARKNADPRAIAMWLARKHTRAALAEIGAYFGGRRHSAVLSAQKKVDGWLHENVALANGDAPDKPVADLLKSLERELTTIQR